MIQIDFHEQGGSRVIDANGAAWLLDAQQTNDLFAHLPSAHPDDADADAGSVMLSGTVMTEVIAR